MSDTITPGRVRRWWTDRKAREARVAAAATARVDADEAQLVRPTGRSAPLTLSGASRQFWSHPSPWIISAMLLGALIGRVVVGGYGVGDLVVPAVMLATFPLTEWLIHVFILHLKPVRVGPVTFDPLLAREHRAHHADPRDLPLVFIPWKVYFWLVPALVAVSAFAFPRLGLGLTYLVVLSAIGMVYEWTHYLIHSDYRPVTRLYRAVWRNHRLHHYKNENYWFTVTTAGTADRLLGTYPDPADVENSPTVKDLLASGR